MRDPLRNFLIAAGTTVSLVRSRGRDTHDRIERTGVSKRACLTTVQSSLHRPVGGPAGHSLVLACHCVSLSSALEETHLLALCAPQCVIIECHAPDPPVHGKRSRLRFDDLSGINALDRRKKRIAIE